jgi:hypothetical protein
VLPVALVHHGRGLEQLRQFGFVTAAQTADGGGNFIFGQTVYFRLSGGDQPAQWPAVGGGSATLGEVLSGERKSALHAHHLPQVCTISTRSFCASITASMSLYAIGRLVDHVGVLAAFDVRGGGDGRPARSASSPGCGSSRGRRRGCRTAEAVLVAEAAHDETLRAHAARDDAQLALARAHRALAGHVHVLAEVMLLCT